MKKIAYKLASFVTIGALNTLVGASVTSLLAWAGVNPLLATTVGYALGLCVSYVLNSRYTFSQRRSKQNVARFMVCFAISFLANLGTVYLATYVFHVPHVIASLTGMPVYTVVFYLLCDRWVFRNEAGARSP